MSIWSLIERTLNSRRCSQAETTIIKLLKQAAKIGLSLFLHLFIIDSTLKITEGQSCHLVQSQKRVKALFMCERSLTNHHSMSKAIKNKSQWIWLNSSNLSLRAKSKIRMSCNRRLSSREEWKIRNSLKKPAFLLIRVLSWWWSKSTKRNLAWSHQFRIARIKVWKSFLLKIKSTY